MSKPIEDSLRATPEDLELWRVYADTLLERGDDRGHAIQLYFALQDDPTDELEDRYASVWRGIRWPKDLPWPPINYRARFQCMIRELEEHPEITVEKAKLAPPEDPAEIERWRKVAGAAWPDGMDALYSQLAEVDIDATVAGEGGSSCNVHLSPLKWMWDYAALEGELWFDFLEADHVFHSIRPIDRFVPEAYGVLYPVPPDGSAQQPAQVAYHYCGESLQLTGLSYREWLELLFRSRGVCYWLQLPCNPEHRGVWTDEGWDRIAELFPDFKPAGIRPATAPESLY